MAQDKELGKLLKMKLVVGREVWDVRYSLKRVVSLFLQYHREVKKWEGFPDSTLNLNKMSHT